MKHTPTPWLAEIECEAPRRVFTIKGADGRLVANYLSFDDHYSFSHQTAFPEDVEYNAAFIIRACNAYDDLVDALENAERLMQQFADWADKQDPSDFDWTAFGRLKSNAWTDASVAREALAKAKGELK